MSRKSFGIALSVVVSFGLGCFLLSPAAAEPAKEGFGGGPRPGLEELDREVRRLAALADRAAGEPELVERVERRQALLLRHMRFLEARLRNLDDPEAVRRLEELELSVRRLGSTARPRAASLTPRTLSPQTPADHCAAAPQIAGGTYAGDTTGADNDGGASCGASEAAPDVWWRYAAPRDGIAVARLVNAAYDTVLSVHTACPGTAENEIACNDDDPRGLSSVKFEAFAGEEVWLRVSGFGGGAGSFTLGVDLAGGVSGTVRRAATGEPVAAAIVTIYDSFAFTAAVVTTNAAGVYAARDLPAGTYFATADGDGLIGELYPEILCRAVFFDCEPTLGTPIEVAAGGTTPGIDFTLDAAGVIAGTVTDAAGDGPVEGASVNVWDAGGSLVGNGFTNFFGEYAAGDLPAGTYFVTTENATGHLDELYDDIPCPGGGFFGCAPTSGTPVAVAAGATTPGVDFVLDRLGAITGTVVAATGGRPISSIGVEIRDAVGSFVAFGFTDANGVYVAGGLPPGAYFVTTRNFSGFLDETFDDVPCPGGGFGGCDPTTGTPVEVAVNATTGGVDFALARLGAVAGTVTSEATGLPIPGVEVFVYDTDGSFETSFLTDSQGRYHAEPVFPGPHVAVTSNFAGYLDEMYDDVPCSGGLFFDCHPDGGTRIDVPLEQTVAGVDFALVFNGSLSGRITDRATRRGISGVEVFVWNVLGEFVVATGTSGETGFYSVIDLAPGTYFATSASSFRYLDELYDDRPCPGGSTCDPTAGAPIEVALSTDTPGIDFALRRLGGVGGTVTSAATGLPLESTTVLIWNAAGALMTSSVTGRSGRYKFDRLLPGTYFVSTDTLGQYRDEAYDGRPCPGGFGGPCDPTAATPVAVALEATTTGVDFRLELANGVEGVVTDAATGAPVSGVFIDVWDAFGSLVLRTRTGAGGRYAASLGQGLYFLSTDNEQGALDEVYDGVPCPAGPAADGLCDVFAGAPVAVPHATVRRGVDFELAGFRCVASSTVLCLGDGRFRAEAFWRTRAGHTGEGNAVRLTGDSGYYWFFSPDNVEVVVKVLDGCDVEPFNSYWVFAAGLTDVEVLLRVTDLATGTVKEYENPLGRPFRPILDTGAFATCSE